MFIVDPQKEMQARGADDGIRTYSLDRSTGKLPVVHNLHRRCATADLLNMVCLLVSLFDFEFVANFD